MGSARDNDVVVHDHCVSAKHCILERKGPHQLVVRDLASTNGTWIDGVRVNEGSAGVGAKLLLGRSELQVLGRQAPRPRIIGHAPALLAAVHQAGRAARTSHPVLLRGESGSGKELFARLVHERSPRASGPLVAINCGALPETLVESELFGHEKGAFTGASERRPGVFEQAAGGTLFLDEIGELPASQQPKLLRVLESRCIRRVGAASEVPVDVRVVTASHRYLQDEVRLGRFRLDLYHRLAAIEIAIPPLRERTEDLPLLASAILEELAVEHGQHRLSDAALDALMRYGWPGNVRELKHVLSRAVAFCDHEVLELDDVLPEPMPHAPRAADPSIDDILRQVMVSAIQRHGSQRRAAKALQMARSTFNERVHRYGLTELFRRK